MADTWDEFPFKDVVGQRFVASESGVEPYGGTILAAYRDNTQIVFEHDNEDSSGTFSCNEEWGSWARLTDGVRVSVPMIGSFMIYC